MKKLSSETMAEINGGAGSCSWTCPTCGKTFTHTWGFNFLLLPEWLARYQLELDVQYHDKQHAADLDY